MRTHVTYFSFQTESLPFVLDSHLLVISSISREGAGWGRGEWITYLGIWLGVPPPPPVNRNTDTSENITFCRTSYMVRKNVCIFQFKTCDGRYGRINCNKLHKTSISYKNINSWTHLTDVN